MNTLLVLAETCQDTGMDWPSAIVLVALIVVGGLVLIAVLS